MQEVARQPGFDKPSHYRSLLKQLEAVLDGLEDEVALMASAACVIHRAIDYASWTGFYRVVSPDLLRIGPYQGPLGCLEIPFGKGVCGSAAARREALVVPDVHAFPGHIACDSEARSEIVVPVLRKSGELFAILDIDSHSPAAFDDDDRTGLEAVAALLQRQL